jgi:hypothetical protein
MSAPPTTIPPAALFAQLAQMPRPSRIIDFPRKDLATGEPVGQLVMQVMSALEQKNAQVASEKFARESLGMKPEEAPNGIGYENIYKNAAAVEILYRVCKRIEDPALPFFPSPKQMREHLTPAEIGVLFSAYLALETELGPIVSDMTEREVDAWIARLAEGGSAFPLVSLSSEGLTDLTLRLARRLHNSSTGTSSSGLPPEENTTSEPEPAEAATEPDAPDAMATTEQ